MKGIILAAGSGSRMYPTTQAISKHLISVYDKPAIYYPLSVLMLMDLKEIAIIVNEWDVDNFNRLLGSGKRFGININYLVQDKPRGIPDAFRVAQEFINNESVALILGDNFFYGFKLPSRLRDAANDLTGASVFVTQVKNPSHFGIVNLDEFGKPIMFVEKPEKPTSNWAVTGLYMFDRNIVDYSAQLIPSQRGETEIVEILNKYLQLKNLKSVPLGRGTAWLDTGTPEGLMSCASFVKAIEDRQGLKISCLEEIALQRNFINIEEYSEHIESMPNSAYKKYLIDLVK